MSRAVRRRRPAALLVLAITLGAAVASVVTSSPAAIVGTRPPVTGAVTVDRRAATRPVVAVPAPPPAAAVAGTADPSAFYVLYATSAQGAGPARVVRLSRPGPVTATGGTLPAGDDLVRAGDSLWVAGGVARAVYRLDPARLILRQRVDLPVPAQAIAATPAALWVADPTSLSCADPLTGRVRATWAAPTPQRVLAADPVRVALLAAGRVLVFPADPRCG